MEDILLVGYGGHAKSVADCIECGKDFHIVGYTDSEKKYSPYPYLGTDDILIQYYNRGVHNAVICVGYLGKGTLRESLYRQLKQIGFRFPVVADPSAIISKSAIIGEGTFVGKGVIINAGASIGKLCIINSAAVIEHDCVIDDFSHISVGTILCGQVRVGKSAFVGANATVIQGQEILPYQIVGAGVTIRGAYMDNRVKAKESFRGDRVTEHISDCKIRISDRLKIFWGLIVDYIDSGWKHPVHMTFVCQWKGGRQWG